jgi:hypothetical protein
MKPISIIARLDRQVGYFLQRLAGAKAGCRYGGRGGKP